MILFSHQPTVFWVPFNLEILTPPSISSPNPRCCAAPTETVGLLTRVSRRVGIFPKERTTGPWALYPRTWCYIHYSWPCVYIYNIINKYIYIYYGFYPLHSSWSSLASALASVRSKCLPGDQQTQPRSQNGDVLTIKKGRFLLWEMLV